MKNLLEYKGYHARVDLGLEDGFFVGSVIGINDSLNFHGNNIEELQKQFEICIDDYIEMCAHFNKSLEKMSFMEEKSMTYEEAIEILDELGGCCTSDKEYKAIHIAIEALEKQIPKKPKMDNDNGIYEVEVCPYCMRRLFPYEHHCKCGQAIDWSDSK